MCGGTIIADLMLSRVPCRVLSDSDLWPDLTSSSKLNIDNIEFFSHPHDYSIKQPQNTSSGNGQAEKKAKMQSKNLYRGIRLRPRGKSATEMRDPRKGVRICFGTFNTTERAARAYNREARKICGKTVKVNFPNEDDTITLQQYHYYSTPNPPCYLPQTGDFSSNLSKTYGLEIGYELNEIGVGIPNQIVFPGLMALVLILFLRIYNSIKTQNVNDAQIKVEEEEMQKVREEENGVQKLSEELIAYEDFLKFYQIS